MAKSRRKPRRPVLAELESRTCLGRFSGKLSFKGWQGRAEIKERKKKPGEFFVKISLKKDRETLDLYDNREETLRQFRTFGEGELPFEGVRVFLERPCLIRLFRKIKEDENYGKYFYGTLFDSEPGDDLRQLLTPSVLLTRRR
jgi:hypothetical protein